MWLQQHQRTISEMAQKMFVKLCREQLPFTGQVDIDGIVCISGGSDLSKKIVIKIHEKLEKVAPRGSGVTEPDLPHGRHSPYLHTKTGSVYTDTPSPNLPKDSHRLQSPEMPQDDNNTLSMSLKIEADGMDSEGSNPESEHLGESEPEREVLRAGRASAWGRSPTARKNTSSATVMKHQVMSSCLASSLRNPASSKLQAATSSALLSTSTVSKHNPSSLSSGGSASKLAKSALTSPSNMPGSEKATPSRNKVPVTGGSTLYEGTSLSCKFCPETYQGFKPLQSHLEQVHKRYLCRQCLSTFSMRCNLRRHERLHQGLKPYRCDQCSKSFARSTDLKIHLNKHGSSPTPHSMQCKRCAKIFPSREMLSKHVYAVHKEKPADLTCEVCDLVCQDPTELEQHQESHLQGSGLLNGLRVHDYTSDDSSEVATDVAQLQDSLTGPEKMQATSNTDNNQKVSSVLQQLLFTSDKSLRCVQARNVIHMDADEDSPLQIDESAQYDDESFPENENNNSKGLHQNCTAFHDDGSEQAEVVSTSPPLHTTAKHASTPKKNRRKKGKPVRVICLDEGEDAYLDDSYQLGGMMEAEATEDLTESSLDGSYLHRQEGVRQQASPIAIHDKAHSVPGSPQALDLSSPHPSAATSLSMLQQLIPNPELELQRENERTPPPCTMPVLVPKTETLNTWERPLTMPILKPKPEVTNNNASSKPKVKKVGTPAPIDPDDLVEREYICQFEDCGKKLTSFHKYDLHSVATHYRYPCKLCRSTFTGRNNRTRHMRHHHGGGGKSHVCGQCGKLFARSDSLREHQYIHTKSYHDQMCHNCGTRCEKKVLLLAHLKKCFGKTRPGKGGTPKAESPLTIEQNKLAEAKQEAIS